MSADKDKGINPVLMDPSLAKPPRSNDTMSPIYQVPRRFDLATMFVVTFAFASFLGVLNAFEVPIIVQVYLVGLLSAVGFVQIFVPARYVRWASVMCGWVVYMTASISQISQQRRPVSTEEMTGLLCGMLIGGSLLGYIAGVVDAGVFLVADYVRKGAIRALGRDR